MQSDKEEQALPSCRSVVGVAVASNLPSCSSVVGVEARLGVCVVNSNRSTPNAQFHNMVIVAKL